MLTFCSVATSQTLAQARVLAAGLRAHEPEARVVVAVLSGLADLRPDEPFEIVRPDDLEAGAVPTPESLPALVLGRALRDQPDGVAVYLDARVSVYGPLRDLVHGASIVLARRPPQLPQDGERPNNADLLVAGRVSPSFVAISGAEGERFATWWSAGVHDVGAPARWLELAPEVFESFTWLTDPGANVSMWNLHERPLRRQGDTILAGDAPLRFFDFAGFRPDRPYLLSDTATRVRPLADEVLAQLCGDYGAAVRESGWRPPADDPTSEERFGNGLPMDGLLRRLWAQAEAQGLGFGDPASPLAAEAFAAWLREPAARGGEGGVNRYLYAVYESRPDLQTAFADLDADAEALIAWGWEHGRRELGLRPELLPASADGYADADDADLTVNVFGYFRDTLGLAEAARLYIEALQAARIPLATTAVAPDIPLDLSSGKTVRRFGNRVYEERQAPYEPAANLVCLNGDHMVAFVKTGGGDLLGERLTIGNWAWETDVLPPSWLPGFDYVDEIWVYSNWVAEKLGRLAPVPVITIPQAIVVPDIAGVDCELIGDERFTFLFMFDFFSTLARKNPLGLIDAFTRAFAPDEGPRLLLKTINESFRPEAAAEIRARIGDRPDIELVDRFLEPAQIAALVARADCYVSLHRSEGFGLTLAESMALGTPVIATAFSGNMDFTTERNSFLVDWRLTRVGPGGEGYPPEGTWAEPDVDHAAQLMRQVWENPEEAARRAARARLDVERLYSPAAAGAVARARLETLLRRERRQSTSRGRSAAFPAIERELALDLRRGAPSRRRATTALRRVTMRAMLPFTLHERNLDRAVLGALEELRAELQRERATGSSLRARVRRLEERLTRAKEAQT